MTTSMAITPKQPLKGHRSGRVLHSRHSRASRKAFDAGIAHLQVLRRRL